MKNSEWQGLLGEELRQIISQPVSGLPQPEAHFEVSQVSPEHFGSMFRASRSVLQVGIGNENAFKEATDVYASPQKIITVTGNTREALQQLLKENADRMVTAFKEASLLAVRKKILKKHWDPTKMKTFQQQGFQLKIPTNYNRVEDNGDFIWYRHHLAGDHSMELLAYTAPFSVGESLDAAGIIAVRNAFGKAHIPGQLEDSYMTTEAAYKPLVREVAMGRRKAYETRGKWEVKGVYMAGPFLNYTVVDKPNNRLIVVEGFTYAPGVEKRDYMFELEAILQTLEIR
jgi:hypothetical protein